jgi:hypothetical protein
VRAQTAVDAHRQRPQRPQRLRHLTGPVAGRRLAVLTHRHLGDQRQPGDPTHRLEGEQQLVQRRERLQHQQVHPAPLQQPRLSREHEPGAVAVERARRVAGRPDGAGHRHLPAAHVARLAGQLDAGVHDLLRLVVQPQRCQLERVGAEGVGLDHIRPGGDEGQVQPQHLLGRQQIRVFRAARAGHGRRQQRAHATVADQRPIAESLEHR